MEPTHWRHIFNPIKILRPRFWKNWKKKTKKFALHSESAINICYVCNEINQLVDSNTDFEKHNIYCNVFAFPLKALPLIYCSDVKNYDLTEMNGTIRCIRHRRLSEKYHTSVKDAYYIKQRKLAVFDCASLCIFSFSNEFEEFLSLARS